jgi:hypothetical protein
MNRQAYCLCLPYYAKNSAFEIFDYCTSDIRTSFFIQMWQTDPATRHGGAWGESYRRYSSYSFLTLALDRGEWSASRPSRALPPGSRPPIPIGQEAGWAPEPIWTQRLEEKSSAFVGGRTPVVQSVIRHYTD